MAVIYDTSFPLFLTGDRIAHDSGRLGTVQSVRRDGSLSIIFDAGFRAVVAGTAAHLLFDSPAGSTTCTP